LFLVGLLIVSASARACNQASDCGDPTYFECVANEPVCQLINGVGISPNKVYWLERCSNGTSSAVSLVRATGTHVERVEDVYEDNTDPNDTSYVESLLGANFKAVYILRSGRFSNTLGEFDVKCDGLSPELSAGSTRPGELIDVAFDDNPDIFGSPFASYVCLGTQIVKYNKLNFNLTDPYTVLYMTGCSYIAYYNNAIYWADAIYNSNNITYTTAFYTGSTSCHNCTSPEPFTSFNNYVNDFDVGNGRIYFARQNWGIQSIALGAELSTATYVISSGNIEGIKVQGKKIFYNDGTTIRSIQVDGSNAHNISNITNSNTCQCATGFSGANCTDCSGQIQTFNGKLSCVPYDPVTGFPSRCILNENCGNTTLASCNQMLAKCECIAGAQAITPLCDTCSNGPITWSNGVPACPV